MRELVAYPNDLQDQRVLDAEFKGVKLRLTKSLYDD